MSCNCHEDISAGTSLLCAVCLSFVMACVTSFEAALCSLVFGCLYFLFMGHPWTGACQSLRIANSFIALMWLIVPWTAGGKILCEAGFFKITETGVHLCLMATIKTNAIILLFLGIMRGMTPMKLGLALTQIHVSQKLALILAFSAQQIDNLKIEWASLTDAAKLRGFEAKASLRAWKTPAAMLAYLLIRAADRAEILHEALLLRGFSGKFPVFCAWHFGRRDFYLTISVVTAILVILSVNSFGIYGF